MLSIFLQIQGGSFKHFALCFLQRTDHDGVKASDKRNDGIVIKQNGPAKPNGAIISNKASDYYVKSEDLTTNLTQRIIQEPEQ